MEVTTKETVKGAFILGGLTFATFLIGLSVRDYRKTKVKVKSDEKPKEQEEIVKVEPEKKEQPKPEKKQETKSETSSFANDDRAQNIMDNSASPLSNSGNGDKKGVKIIGKIDKLSFEKNRELKKRVFSDIARLEGQLKNIGRNNYEAGKDLRNKIALLKAKLWYL